MAEFPVIVFDGGLGEIEDCLLVLEGRILEDGFEGTDGSFPDGGTVVLVSVFNCTQVLEEGLHESGPELWTDDPHAVRVALDVLLFLQESGPEFHGEDAALFF